MAVRSFAVPPSNGRLITLADLRELVEETAGLAPDSVVHAQAAMRGQDFSNPSGMVLREITVVFERPAGATVQPT